MKKGHRDVYKLMLGKKGEFITAIVCYNVEGNFLFQICIFKGVNKKVEDWKDQMT